MLWGYPTESANSSDTHLRSRFPFMELGGVLRARRAPATGGKEAAQGGDAVRQALSLGREARWRQLLLSARTRKLLSGGAAGSTRLGERRKREGRRGELGAELASPAGAYATTAPPRLRLRRRPPRGPPPEARWRQFRRPGSPHVLANDVGVSEAGAQLGRSLRLVGPGAGGAGPRGPEGLQPSHRPGAEPCLSVVTSRRAVWLLRGRAYLERDGWRCWALTCRRRPPSFPSPSLHAQFGRPRAFPPLQEQGSATAGRLHRVALTTVGGGGGSTI